MAVYKQKYEEGQRRPVNRGGPEGSGIPDDREFPEASSQGRQRKQEAKHRPAEKRRQGPQPRSREEEPNRAEGSGAEKPSRRRHRGKNIQTLRGDSSGPATVQGSKTTPPAGPKKGILSRIFGLFKKD
jgi:hypothetical protein